MNSINLIDYVVELSEPILWLSFTMFLWWTIPPRAIQQLYPFGVRFLWLMPFSNRWRERVAPEHEEQIRKFRTGAFAYATAILVLPLLRAAYYKFLFMRLHALQ